MTFDSNEVQLEPALPRQAVSAAVLIFDTDPALWNCLFSNDLRSALRFFEEEWQAEESVFGHSLGTTATLDGGLMGIELGFDRATRERYQSGTGRRGRACLSPETLKGFRANGRYVPYLIPPTPKEVYYVQFLSIAPQVRGRGLGSRLLGNAFARAKQQGYKACQLDVSSDNQAVAFYLRMGMEILSESRVIRLEERGVHSHYRMVKAL
jgi:ribosomal protein S18 acetylase RimI-like enzyme